MSTSLATRPPASLDAGTTLEYRADFPDFPATGWTLTLAARALREAGATAVLPLTLAVRA